MESDKSVVNFVHHEQIKDEKKDIDIFEEELKKVKEEYKNKSKDVNNLDLYKRELKNILEAQDGSKFHFTLMQFNILADFLSGAHGGQKNPEKGFIKSPLGSLEWKFRGLRIIEEIKRFSPDIITLEEVDQFEFLKKHLTSYNYSGQHYAKPTSPCLEIGKDLGLPQEELKADGVAIFYNNKIFDCQEKYFFDEYKNEKNFVPIAALGLHLCTKDKKKEFLVVSMHLKSAKTSEGETIRLLQLEYLFSYLKRLLEKLNNIPLFIGCDLNSPPKNTEGFPPYTYRSIILGEEFINDEVKKYQILRNNNDDDEEKERNKYKQKEARKEENLKKDKDKDKDKDNIEKNKENLDKDKKKENSDYVIVIPKDYVKGYSLNLSSAYRDGLNDKEPDYTTYKQRFKGISKHTIDYIFYQKYKNIRVTKLLSIPEENIINHQTFIPGWEYPSDHFAIMAQFEL